MACPPAPEGPGGPAGAGESGAERLARRMREARGRPTSPQPTAAEREMFFSLLGYHYGTGTIDEEEFSRRMELVHTAGTLAELYELTADLPYPPPLADLKSAARTRARRRLS